MTRDFRQALSALLARDPYQAYTYSYPHKTAYRALTPPVDLRRAWQAEDRHALFLYVHVPFCEQRCGFCNLFTQAQPPDATTQAFLDTLERQAGRMADILAPATFARMAVGGGTPSLLSPAGLRRLFDITRGLGAGDVPCSLEVSPVYCDEDRVDVLRSARVRRVSMGVQSIFPAETAAVHRHQSPDAVRAGLGRLRSAGIPTVNADLMFGLPGQTADTVRASIDAVIEWGANELYLYPLYVRPLTTLARRGLAPGDTRPALYAAARDHLASLGWQRRSLRMFQAPGVNGSREPMYRCQSDGMVGLGPGARSYTRALHYATPFAVAQPAVRALVETWCQEPDAAFDVATWGITLDAVEQRRRWLILSVLEHGVLRGDYRERFGADVLTDFPELEEAVALGLLTIESEVLSLTARGVEHADVIGQWLYSPAVRDRMDAWITR